MKNLGYVVIILIILIAVACVTINVVDCQVGYGVAGTETIASYLFGGTCSGLALGTTVSNHTTGVLNRP